MYIEIGTDHGVICGHRGRRVLLVSGQQSPQRQRWNGCDLSVVEG